MKENELMAYIDAIDDTDNGAFNKAIARQSQLAKPPGSLGKLEEISARFAAITGEVKNHIKKKAVVILCADNGVVCEGVTSTPQSVTAAQTMNFTMRKTGVGALAKNFDVDLCIVDMGVNAKFPKPILSTEMFDFLNDKIIDRKIRMSTSNLAKGPAMSRNEAILAIEAGIEAAELMKARDYDIIGVGEMGIGNTTTSAAVLSALTKCPVEISVGRGGGLNDKGFERKKEIVKARGLEEDYDDVLDVLANVGGFDICAMVGVFLGASKNRLPVVIDGYISAVAALAAYRLNPLCKEYMFASHCSEEAGYQVAIDELGLSSMLDLDMRLGEGSGCVLAFEIIKGALGVINDMATYDEAQIDENYLELMADAKF